MGLVKECHNLADKTSIQGGIPIELADHVDAGLEIVVRKRCMCVFVFIYIIYLLYMLLYIFVWLSNRRILSSVHWLFIFLFSIFCLFTCRWQWARRKSASQIWGHLRTTQCFSVLILEPLKPFKSEASDNFMYMSLIFFFYPFLIHLLFVWDELLMYRNRL